MSRTYLETVLSSPGITPEVRARAKRALVVVATNQREEIGDGEPLLDLGRGPA